MLNTLLVVIGLLLVSMLIGYLLKGKLKKYENFLNKLLIWSIYLLLFLMGVSIGNNPKIMNNLTTLGIQAFWITLGAVAGSLLMAYLLYKIWKK